VLSSDRTASSRRLSARRGVRLWQVQPLARTVTDRRWRQGRVVWQLLNPIACLDGRLAGGLTLLLETDLAAPLMAVPEDEEEH
jgi:hypothetical protein